MINGSFSATTLLANSSKDRDDMTKVHSLESLQPVPMSDTVLKQCLFVYHDYFKFWQLITGGAKNRSDIDIDGDDNILNFMRRPMVKKVASLHQLQNIYFKLKGKKLVFRNNP